MRYLALGTPAMKAGVTDHVWSLESCWTSMALNSQTKTQWPTMHQSATGSRPRLGSVYLERKSATITTVKSQTATIRIIFTKVVVLRALMGFHSCVQELAELRRLHGDSDGLGTRPLRAPSDLVFHYLTLTEFLDSRSLERRVMEEQVVAPIPFDEPKTSIRNQPLDFTLWHFCSPT